MLEFSQRWVSKNSYHRCEFLRTKYVYSNLLERGIYREIVIFKKKYIRKERRHGI